MAKYKGCLGTAEAGATPDTIINITDWEFNVAREALDATAMDGTCNSSTILGTKKTSGSFSYWFDDADAGQLALDSDTAVTLNLYPRGNSSGNTKYTGSVLVTTWGASANVAGVQQGNASWEVDGQLTRSTIV